ncbi:aldehyde dehydrogenase family protein [Pseudomonas sp.]|jgi:phenylacetate-CoA ligase|uniref:aldehyde dehydrogenase family protein n=1 Tax=Pseudomonas sp. TaxID=306 RepID=UPI002E314914|nr:aldehyde dehydrogenase family protein [Pseudomonas sp.]HEX4550234.1 aldehyde dehydrogenase family protein [Pseudomonas sp.]
MFLINGQLRDNANLTGALQALTEDLPQRLQTPLEISTLFSATQAFIERLRDPHLALPLDAGQRQALIDFCQPQALQAKLERELGLQADSLRRTDYRHSRFERWSPLGLVVHITPANAPLLAFCAVVESLLCGNVNWLRPSSSDGDFTARLLGVLLECDPSGQLKGHVAVLPASTAQIAELCKPANGVAAWGGETALKAIRQQLAPGCRWIDWGHRISFIYLTPDCASPQTLDAVADEVCRLDQQACSSPQWLLVDSDDASVLRDIGSALADAFSRRAGHWPALTPTLQEASQITTQTAMAQLGQSFAGQIGQVWSAPGWRIIWNHDQQLQPSPLFRSLLLKPLPRALLTEALLPWRNVLQSCALLCRDAQLAPLAQTLIGAGVTRIAPLAAIHDGYDGEPHDGVYALQRLSRRVSVSLLPDQLANHATLDRQSSPVAPVAWPIMSKQTFVSQPVNVRAQLYFRSGGSSGTPALSGFSYRDFHSQMRAAADGLLAAGLEPARDRVMNLFFGGNLYGGFYSFAKVLEQLGATHLPMGAPADDDYRHIAQLIVEQRVNVLVGMPGTVHRLFLNEQQRLRDYGGIEKVFLGGEHLGDPTRALLQDCGVTLVRSALYGTVDAGPIGHACSAATDGVFHVMSAIQEVQIVGFERDEAVAEGEPGRLLVTSSLREGQTVQRYDVGDSARWIGGPCACGLPSPRFELLQRHGQLMRIGTDFISLSELAQHLQQAPFQLILERGSDGRDCMRLLSDQAPAQIHRKLQGYLSLNTLIQAGLLTLEVERCAVEQFRRNRHSGKTPLLIDTRD